MVDKLVCPKCGSTEFIVRIFVDLKIDPNRNFGNIKYDWIEKVVCANLGCSYDLSESEDEKIQDTLMNVTKNLISSMREETLILK